MLSKSYLSLLALSVLSFSDFTLGRERWLERDGRAVFLYPRRFGQEHPAVIDKIGQACPGQVCGVLSGKAITPLLAAQPECSQQDMADEIIGELVIVAFFDICAKYPRIPRRRTTIR